MADGKLGYRERQAVLALSGGVVMHLRITVTEREREMIRRAAKQSAGRTVSEWATLNLIDVAQIEAGEA